MSLPLINFAEKAEFLPGKIEAYWFENLHLGIQKTLFHSVTLPIKPFDSGFDCDENPLSTEIRCDFINLSLVNPYELDGIDINVKSYPQIDASMYLGNAHNPCDFNKLLFEKVDQDTYKVYGDIFIDFPFENIAKSENVVFETYVKVDRKQSTR